MQRTTVLQEDWWNLRAEATWGNASAGQDLVALCAENDQLRRASAGRAVIDQARGMVMVPTPAAAELPGTCRTVRRSARSIWSGSGLPSQAATRAAATSGSLVSDCREMATSFQVADQGRDSRQPGKWSR